ncbi:hypothetical protein AB1Y20_012304 [Prymnesium parvum]|uniref:protein-tyrosine-phosphatase n=1 Tax=Prymnesium parvum TaxID=97485 RepID=A0AB34IQL6_PRYPA
MPAHDDLMSLIQPERVTRSRACDLAVAVATGEARHAARAMAAVLPWLYMGDKAVAKDRTLLRQLNVRYIVNVTPPRTDGGVANFFEKEHGFEYLRLPLRDMNTESLLDHLPKAVAFLQRARVRADGRVLVHCNEGKSRSASVVIGYLIQTHGVGFAEALEMVRAARPQAEPKEAFCRQLASLHPALLDGGGAAHGSKRPSEPGGGDGAAPAKRRAIGPPRGPPSPEAPAIGPAIGPAPPPASHAAAEAADDSADAAAVRIGPSARP